MPALARLYQSLVAESPRLSPRRAPWQSYVIGGAAMIALVLLTLQALFRANLAGWSVGIAYIGYDTALLIFTARHSWRLMRPVAAVAAPASRPTLGVIVAAHNEAGVLGVTIDQLVSASAPPELILIADDGSSDATPEVMAERFGLEPPPLGTISPPSPVLPSLRWLRVPHGGKARALNAAIVEADTEIVLTVDADTLLDPGALAAMRAAFAAEPELVAATGVLAPICGPSRAGRLFQWFQSYEYVRNFLGRYAWMQAHSLLLVSGAFAAFRRTALVDVGGFDPVCLVEDYELIHRLHRHAADRGLDWRVRVVGAARARTDAPASVIGFLKQRRRWFGGFLQTHYWNRDMIGNRHFGMLGTAHMPVKTLDTLQPVAGVAAFIILLTLLALGRFVIALPILIIMIVKIVFDLSFLIWSLRLYARWTGQVQGLSVRGALLAAALEPFSFQLLRHAGALWGWHAFLTGKETWGRQKRTALEAAAE
ncbi:MAG: glycosyltransferase [Sphingomonas sp.]|uniref:glycosyltransferase family 2 protein n=1 Tax=Sphingomonas sp. TaxID=28214 RepID=UPI0025DD6FA3|nr:glycosyltransferase [Sphingomonas sp.]MBY0285453.1 glycosyltransferase [Sphingomonas sp.]